MEKTEVLLKGSNVERFLRMKRIPAGPDNNRFHVGDVVVGQDAVETLFGKLQISHGLVTNSNNQEVVIVCPELRRRGTRNVRRISVRNDTGCGQQQITKGVVLEVKTSAQREIFEANTR